MLPPVLKHMESLGYAVFYGEYNLNLFGIRSPSRESDSYDDLLGCAYQEGSAWRVHYWPGTTDPGKYYLETASKDFGVSGTAILAPGQYRGAYEIGPHGSTKYRALVQTGAPVSAYRDANKDTILDTNCSSPIETGWYGLNIHSSSMQPYEEDKDKTNYPVGRWSGGCQVHATTSGFVEMRQLAELQVYHRDWGRFTYTLLESW